MYQTLNLKVITVEIRLYGFLKEDKNVSSKPRSQEYQSLYYVKLNTYKCQILSTVVSKKTYTYRLEGRSKQLSEIEVVTLSNRGFNLKIVPTLFHGA